MHTNVSGQVPWNVGVIEAVKTTSIHESGFVQDIQVFEDGVADSGEICVSEVNHSQRVSLISEEPRIYLGNFGPASRECLQAASVVQHIRIHVSHVLHVIERQMSQSCHVPESVTWDVGNHGHIGTEESSQVHVFFEHSA